MSVPELVPAARASVASVPAATPGPPPTPPLAPTRAAAPAAPQPAPAPPPIIEIRGLVKRYPGHTAVDGLDLTVFAGEIFGILGPNGAGKTTTMEVVEGLRAPDAGTVRVMGLDPVAAGDAVRRRIGVQLQTTALFDYLSVAELVALFADLYGMADGAARVTRLLAAVGLGEKAGARVAHLSGGQKQRVAIALALVNDPEIVFLDEPTTGLDPAARRALWATVRAIRDGGATVVLTTHSMDEAETLCDRVAVMDRGRIVACAAPAALVRDLGAAATIRARLATPSHPDPPTPTPTPRPASGSPPTSPLSPSLTPMPSPPATPMPAAAAATMAPPLPLPRGEVGPIVDERDAAATMAPPLPLPLPLPPPPPLPMPALAALPGVIEVGCAPADRCDDLTLHTTDAQTTLVALLALAAEHGASLADLSIRQANLEDVFLALTGRPWQDDPAPPPAAAPRRRRRT